MRSAAVVTVMAILLVAGLGAGYLAGNGSRQTETLTSTSTSVSTQTMTATIRSTATTTITSLSTQTITQTLPAQCLGGNSSLSGGYFGTLDVGTISPAVVCLQLYEFDTNSSFVVNSTRLINIEGFNPETGQTFHGLSNFTITASSGSIDLGGPTNASEGIVVALAITAKPGTSGTYWGFVTQGQNPPETAVPTNLGYQQAYYLSDQGGEQGCENGILVAGTGQPDYLWSGDCLGGYLDCTTGFHIQGVSYNICSNELYFRIIGATNSTQ